MSLDLGRWFVGSVPCDRSISENGSWEPTIDSKIITATQQLNRVRQSHSPKLAYDQIIPVPLTSQPFKTMTLPAENYPFAQEFITDSNGQIRKVILDIQDYYQLLEMLEDEGLYRAMNEVRSEIPLDRAAALAKLES